MPSLIRAAKRLLVLLSTLMLWLVCSAALMQLIEVINTEHYQTGDTPAPQFYIGVIHEGCGVYGMPLQDVHNTPAQWARQPESECMEDCLYAEADDTLVYRNEGALQHTKSRYRIANGRIIPVSHTRIHSGHTFAAMAGGLLLARFLPGFLHCLWQHWRHRHRPEQAAACRRALVQRLKRSVLWLAAFLLACAGLGVFQAA